MGGAGTWYTAIANPDRFAAIVPICGWGHPEAVTRIVNLPVWAFHGSADATIPPEGSRSMVLALEEAGSSVVRYTEYPGVGHECWELAYREDTDGNGIADLVTWMFSHRTSR
jgi:predicted peptidase